MTVGPWACGLLGLGVFGLRPLGLGVLASDLWVLGFWPQGVPLHPAPHATHLSPITLLGPVHLHPLHTAGPNALPALHPTPYARSLHSIPYARPLHPTPDHQTHAEKCPARPASCSWFSAVPLTPCTLHTSSLLSPLQPTPYTHLLCCPPYTHLLSCPPCALHPTLYISCCASVPPSGTLATATAATCWRTHTNM